MQLSLSVDAIVISIGWPARNKAEKIYKRKQTLTVSGELLSLRRNWKGQTISLLVLIHIFYTHTQYTGPILM